MAGMAIRCWRFAAGMGMALLLAALAGCGGSGGGASPPVASPLPDSVTLAGPSRAETGEATRWPSTLTTLQPGWSLEWDFGDGARSTDLAPTHAYARGGDYTVTLTVSNGGSDRRVASGRVQVGAFARVQGLVCSGAAASGWCWQQPQPFARDLLDAALVDDQTAFAVGPGNTVLATRNGGIDWAAQSAPAAPVPTASANAGAANRLDLVRFLDTRVGVAASSFPGRLLRTEDGGATWAATSDPSMYWIKAVWLPDRLTIVVSGFARFDRFGYGSRFADSTVVSVDGGQTWRNAALVVSTVTAGRTLWDVPLYGLGAVKVSRDLGLTAVDTAPCCSSYVELARPPRAEDADLLLKGAGLGGPANATPPVVMHRSIDAGLSWTTVTVQPPGADPNLRLVTVGFRSSTEAWATFRIDATPTAGSAWQRARSLDGGRTWAAVGPRIENPLGLAEPLRVDDASYVLPSPSSTALWFADGDTGTRTLQLPLGGLASFVARRGNLLLAGYGAPDRWYTSRDDGGHWAPLLGSQAVGGQAAGGQDPIRHLRFFDIRQGLAADSQGMLRATSDGGRTWTLQARDGPAALGNLNFTADATGWGAADGALWRSRDRGKTWQRVATPAGDVQAWYALDAQRLWATVFTCGNATDFSTCSTAVHATTDGGASWTRLSAPSQRVHFTSERRGIAMSFGSLAYTRDGGITWAAATGDTLPGYACEYKARFVDEQHGWILCSGIVGPRGGTASVVLRTVDGGQTWAAARDLPSGAVPLADLAFGDADNGWLVGANGLVLASRDGGATWQAQASGTARDLSAVTAHDAVTAWVGGDRGTVLATATGGR